MTEAELTEVNGLLARFYSIIDKLGNHREPFLVRQRIQERLAEFGVQVARPVEEPPEIVA